MAGSKYGDEVENGVPIVALIKLQLLIRAVSCYGATFQSLVKQGSPPLKANLNAVTYQGKFL